MTIKRRDPEFLHPDTVAQLQGLTDEEAAKQPPLIRERDGVFMQQRRIGRRVRCREVEASGVPALETGALHAAAEAEFGRLLPLLTAGFPGGGVPDLDAIETSIRDGMLGGGAKRYAALLETVDARLAGKSRPSCPSCGRRMERRGRVGKTFGTRLGEARVKRRYFYCRKCGVGDYPLDRALRLAGKRVTPGAEAVYADAAGSDSCGEARRKLRNLAGGVEGDSPAPQRQDRRRDAGVEREDAEAAPPAAERVLLGIDGPESRWPPACGSSGSGTACSRPLVVLSDGAPWIRNSCEEAFPGQETTFILDLFHALEYADAAVKAVQPDKSKQEDWMKTIKDQLNAGRVDDVIAGLEPHRSGRDLHPLLRDQQGPNALRPLPEARTAGRIRRRGKRQADRRQPIQRSRAPKIGANAVLAIKCCFRNNRWPDFLDWRDCSAAAA